MRASSGRDWLRASDGERDEAIGELRRRFAEGRLSQDTFLCRMDAALQAKVRSELYNLFADLPADEQGARRPARAALPRVARLWRAARDRLSIASRRRVSIEPEPQSLCLPRLADGRFTIGRAPSCDFTVADVTVSRWHARLYKEEDSWLLSDLGSTNGTRLNGWRVTSAVPVQAGDEVSFGSAAYVIIDRPVTADQPEAAV
jgi:hypothetical protein